MQFLEEKNKSSVYLATTHSSSRRLQFTFLVPISPFYITGFVFRRLVYFIEDGKLYLGSLFLALGSPPFMTASAESQCSKEEQKSLITCVNMCRRPF